jgi:hypothetical protein
MIHFIWNGSSLFARINIQLQFGIFVCDSTTSQHAICKSLGVPYSSSMMYDDARTCKFLRKLSRKMLDTLKSDKNKRYFT